jgi:hypothetical protein
VSITFSSNAAFNQGSRKTACLCAQGAPSWSYPCDNINSIRDELREYARPHCPFCNGTGIDVEVISDRPTINWCNANAVIMLEVLGLPTEFHGVVSIHQARRAVIRARGRGSLSRFARGDQVIHGQPRDDGAAVELRPVRTFIGGLSEEQIIERIQAFASFVEASAARGATAISWA